MVLVHLSGKQGSIAIIQRWLVARQSLPQGILSSIGYWVLVPGAVTLSLMSDTQGIAKLMLIILSVLAKQLDKHADN